MVRRLAATSALVLAAFALAPAARAQEFFGLFETSPREVLNRLEDDGYSPRLPMIRRGEIYIVDALTASGRSVRLVVDARDGRVLERYAAARSVRDDDYDERRAPRRFADDTPDDQPLPPRRIRPDPTPAERQSQTAWGDPLPRSPRDDADGQTLRPEPSGADKAKQRAAKKRRDVPAKDAAVAAPAPDVTLRAASPKAELKPEPRPEAPAAKPEPKLATVRPDASPKPAPEAAPFKPASPKPEVAAKPTPAPTSAVARTEPKPEPKLEPKPEFKLTPAKPSPEAVQPGAEAKAAEPAPKPETPRKKLNDLPVGTLD